MIIIRGSFLRCRNVTVVFLCLQASTDTAAGSSAGEAAPLSQTEVAESNGQQTMAEPQPGPPSTHTF